MEKLDSVVHACTFEMLPIFLGLHLPEHIHRIRSYMTPNEKVTGRKRQIVHTVFEKTKITQCGYVKKMCK